MTDAPFTFTLLAADGQCGIRCNLLAGFEPGPGQSYVALDDITRALAERDLVILPRGSNEAVFQQLCEQLTTRVKELETENHAARTTVVRARHAEGDAAISAAKAERERDEARAELERTRHDLATEKSRGDDHLAAFAKKDQILRERNAQLQELRAELERVETEARAAKLDRIATEERLDLSDAQANRLRAEFATAREEALNGHALLRLVVGEEDYDRNGPSLATWERAGAALDKLRAVGEAAMRYQLASDENEKVGGIAWKLRKRELWEALDALASAGSEPKRAGVESESGVRVPGCKCHWEEGDSPCPVHGEDEEPATEDPAPKQGEATSDWGPGREGELRRKLGAARGLLYAYPDITQDEVTSILEETADLHPSNTPAGVPVERVEALLRGARVRLENWACHMATGYERGRSEVAVFTLELLGELFPTAKPDAGGGG